MSWKCIAFGVRLCLISAFLTIASGCRSGTNGSSSMGTYPMGQRVQVGPLTYNVIEADWRTELEAGASGKIPKHRFLLIKLSITNSASSPAMVPIFFIENANGETFPEDTENMDSVPQWLGLLRNVSPSGTEHGAIVFDVPLGPYKLRVTDGGDLGQEQTALIEIPVDLQ